MEKLFYETPVIDVCEVLVESGFASSPSSTDSYKNDESQGW